MAAGDVTLFEEFTREIGEKIYNLSSDTLKFGIIDNTLAPVKSIATPRWADWSVNQVSGTGYTADGNTLTTVTWTEADGVSTLKADSFTISQNGAGFTGAYWGIIYSSTATNDEAICFVELGTAIGNDTGDVVVKFNNVASGSPGAICTHSD